MKTKNIFKALALAMLLTTACVNNEIPNENGYTLPVTINVTRQGDAATRATYTDNGDGTGSLAFSTGDQLFILGAEDGEGMPGWFYGTLTWQSVGTFSGTLTTENKYTGTIDAIIESSHAYLLPAGYDTYDFLTVSTGEGWNASVEPDFSKTFADTKAIAVEQFSFELGDYNSLSGCIELEPMMAILNFTITGLTPTTEYAVVLNNGTEDVGGNVTTDASGNATFAVSVLNDTESENLTLTVGGNPVALNLDGANNRTLAKGKIYNISRSAAPVSLIVNPAVGQVIGNNGKNYADATAASADGATAVAVICYVGDAGTADASSATYKGLALALTDVSGTYSWCDKVENCLATQYKTADGAKTDMAGIANTDALVGNVSHTHAAASAARNYNSGTYPTGTSAWFLPSAGQWEKMATAAGGFSTLMSNANMKSWPYYWSSTDYGDGKAWTYAHYSSEWDYYGGTSLNVRACLAF